MNYEQGDLVYLNNPFELPDGSVLDHPLLIVSSPQSNGYENHYTGIMMTSKSGTDRYSFRCNDNMFESPLAKQGCQLRMFILVSFSTHEVYRKVNAMQPFHLKNILRRLKSQIFSISNE